MFVALNHEIVPAAQAVLPVATEGLRYGSGCFETIAYTGGAPRFWQRHMERFNNSCARLGLEPRVSPAQLRQLLAELVQRSAAAGVSPQHGQSDGQSAKASQAYGQGNVQSAGASQVRGQSGGQPASLPEGVAGASLAQGAGQVLPVAQLPAEGVVRISAHQCGRFADVVMTFGPPRYGRAPESFSAMLSQQRHPGAWAYSGIKHNNYVQFLAAMAEASAAGFDEALLADASGHVLEGSRTNLFAVQKTGGGWCLRTAPLQSGVLAGVMRSVVLDIASQCGFVVSEVALSADELRQAHGCFVTNALAGVVPVSVIGTHRFDAEANIVSAVLRQAMLRLQD